MEEKVKNISEELKTKLGSITNLKELNDLRVEYLGKKGPVSELTNLIGTLSNEEKKVAGKVINDLKNEAANLIEEKKNVLELEELNDKLNNEKIDASLPGTCIRVGGVHPLEKLTEEVEELFISMGYDIEEGPEVEKDLYNFELLNLPIGHPARDAQDTFYITDEMLLRSQTSPVQIRTMLANKEKTPIRIICPGKTYRRDNDDATHSHQFAQIEGLLVDYNVSLADLKGTFEVLAKKLFGDNVISRFRPSFYPFTEPSVETDISCFKCAGVGCSLCKGTGWITVGGAGMVHPNVLRNCGYDPEKMTGFAFGFGVERLTMLKYGISDIRHLFINDLRINEQFDKKEGV